MTEDTQRNEALIEEMLRASKPTELPSELISNPVLHKGDEVLPSPMVVQHISSAGYVYVWDTRSYEKIPILYYMLPSKLRMRRPDGSYKFTVIDPKEKPKRGGVKCLLHKDSEHRAHYDELGFHVCPKGNLINQHQLRMHMLHKHKEEWAAIEQERIDKERAEDRALQQAMLRVQTSQLERLAEPTKVPNKGTLVCPSCSADFTNKVAYEKHIKEQHS